MSAVTNGNSEHFQLFLPPVTYLSVHMYCFMNSQLFDIWGTTFNSTQHKCFRQNMHLQIYQCSDNSGSAFFAVVNLNHI